MFDEEHEQDSSLEALIEGAAPVVEEAEEEAVEEQQEALPPRSNKEENFRALREKTERLERERDDAIRLAQSIYAQQNKQPTPPEEDDDVRLSDSDFVEGTHLNKVQKKIKKLEGKLQEYEKNAQTYTIESRLKSQFPDFDAIVNVDNLKMLREYEPAVADAILAAPDLYNQGVLAYKMVKQMNVAPKKSFDKEREVAHKNAAKPRNTAAINTQHGESPLTKANAFAQGLTEELKAQLLKEMTEARKSI